MPDRLAVRHSRVHGRGLYATADLPAADRLIEYLGEVLPWDVATDRYHSEGTSGVTYFFDLGDGRVIDGAVDGSGAEFINHGCAPNCEAIDEDGHIWIHSLRAIRAGEELLLDYGLIVDDPDDPDYAELYACRCAADGCRGTMLAAT